MKIEFKMTSEQVDSFIKLSIAITFCLAILNMIFLSMYSLVFGQNPMNNIAPADKQFFFLLSDMSKYILGSLGTMLAIKGKEKLDEWRGNNNDNDNKQVVEQNVIIDPTPEDPKSPEDVKPV
jgi:hypothetical protein